MSHQEVLWLLQSCWEAVTVLGPVVLLALLTWRVAKWAGSSPSRWQF